MTSSDDDSFNASVDTTGLRCPEPLMIIRRELRKLAPGQALRATGDDPATPRDAANLCQHLGYALEFSHKNGDFYECIIRKPPAADTEPK